MAHITVKDELPGIVGLLDFDSETARPLSELAQVLLRRTTGLSAFERELIATHVSSLNQCRFCATSHRAAARHVFAEEHGHATDDLEQHVSGKLNALLAIAAMVQRGGRSVSPAQVAHAREAGATDQDIHDTVLIAAAFCMYNRYVDGLATWCPDDPAVFDAIGARLASDGYVATVGQPA